MSPLQGTPISRRLLVAGLCSAGVLSAVPRTSQASTAAGLDERVYRHMRAAGIPGLALGLARDGDVIDIRPYGLADERAAHPVGPDTLFHIASITKTVTALATTLLAQDGRLGLDDPIAGHLDFEIAGGANADRITWRHLLMHTSGLSDRVYYETDFRSRGTDSPVSLRDFLLAYLAPGGRYTGTGNLIGVPGAQWNYCNVGYGLLGYLAQRVVGEDLRDWMKDRLFRPLGLKQMTWRLADVRGDVATPYERIDGALVATEPVGFPDWPAGMLRSSAADLTRLMALMANGGSAAGRLVLSPGANAEMLRMQRPEGLPDWLTGQGLGWQESLLDGHPTINHWGGDPGVFTMAYLDPASRSAVVVLSNLSATPESRNALKAIASEGLHRLRRAQTNLPLLPPTPPQGVLR